jgi:hypothetical protein
MATSEERLRILKLIEEGKITAEEGARLLAALNKGSRRQASAGESDLRWLRVRVTDLRSGKPALSVNLPMSVVNVGLRVGARFVPDVEGIDLTSVASALQKGVTGKIMDVVDEDEGQRVEIYVE